MVPESDRKPYQEPQDDEGDLSGSVFMPLTHTARDRKSV